MFRRVTNIDLLNKILELENKIDILNTRINTSEEGCCDCKVKELTIYKEIKSYFETKFESILTSLKEISNDNENFNETQLNYILENYKAEIISSFENIILNLESLNNSKEIDTNWIKEYFLKIINKLDDLKISELTVQEKIKDYNISKDITHMNELLDNVNIIIKDICVKFDGIINKIDLLYYENETIKHQFLIEEDIRKYEFDIDNLKFLINNTIEMINKIINN